MSSFWSRSAVDQIARRHHGLDADQQPLAAHFREHGGIAIDHGGQLLFEQQRHLLHMVEEAGLQHHVEHRVGGGDRQRIAAEGRAVRARRHAGGGLRGRKARADRKAAAERFRQRHRRRA